MFPQEYAPQLLPALVRAIGHLRWQEEINAFQLAHQHLNMKHMLHHEQNSLQIFLFFKLFVLTFFSLFVAQLEPRLQKKMSFVKDILGIIQRWFEYGLQTLHHYWIRWHNSSTLFVLLLYTMLCEPHDKKIIQSYVALQWMLQYLHFVLHFKTFGISYNSS